MLKEKRHLGVGERRDAGQLLALEELERGAAARRHVRDLVLGAVLLARGRRVAAADDGDDARLLRVRARVGSGVGLGLGLGLWLGLGLGLGFVFHCAALVASTTVSIIDLVPVSKAAISKTPIY